MIKQLKIYLHGGIVDAEIIRRDETTYITPLLICKIISGEFTGEKIAIFENGDKHVKTLGGI